MSKTIEQTREEWMAERKGYLGASDAASVVNCGNYGCSLKLFKDKTGVPKDFDDSDKAEFRRGRRLEQIAAEYYEEVTGRELRKTKRVNIPGRPYLAVSMDRVAFRKEDADKKNPGYAEIKCVGRWSMNKIKKEGLPADYITQVNWGCSVADLTWGVFIIYSPETDELLHWEFTHDKAFGDLLLDRGTDFWEFNVGLGIPPERLPEGSSACKSCPWMPSCRGEQVAPIPVGVIERPDLAGLIAKFHEVKGMSSEAGDAEEEIKAEILAAIKEKPGTYSTGRHEFVFQIAETKRFSGEKLKRSNPELYESLREKQVTKTLKRPREL